MDHAEARELLDLAAVEPGGLDRLMAGDTPVSIALAGHLAGCPDCMEEFGGLRRSSAVLRDVIATLPPADLRERTLAMIAAVGRPRGEMAAPASAQAQGAAVPVASVELSDAAVPVVSAGAAITNIATARTSSGRRPVRSRLAWMAAAAALVLVSVGATGFAVSSAKDAAARQASQQLEGLAEVATWTVRLDAQPDVRHVVLKVGTPGGGDAQIGTLIFSPGTQGLVVVADGMPAPPAGQEYRCWVEVAGARQRLGKMYLSGDLAYWVGDAPVLATVPSGAVFGVNLADISGSGGSSPTILSGTLQAT